MLSVPTQAFDSVGHTIMATATSFDGAPKNRTVSAVAAEWWIDRGYFPVPVAHHKERASGEGWQNLRIGQADVVNHFIRDPLNIGVLMGDERGSADVDLDCREAIQAAPEFLPPTGLIFGRKSKPASHWFYLCDPPIPSSTFRDPVDNRMIVELRCQTSGGGIGLQTVVHPPLTKAVSRSSSRLECDRNPIVADSGILKKAVVVSPQPRC